MMLNMWEMKVQPCADTCTTKVVTVFVDFIDDQDEEGTISEQEQVEEDKDNDAEIQQLNKEGMPI